MAARRVTLLVQSQFLAKHFVSFSEVIKIILVKSSLRYVRFNPCMVRFRSHLIDIYLCGNVSNLYGNVFSIADVLAKEMQSVVLFLHYRLFIMQRYNNYIDIVNSFTKKMVSYEKIWFRCVIAQSGHRLRCFDHILTNYVA